MKWKGTVWRTWFYAKNQVIDTSTGGEPNGAGGDFHLGWSVVHHHGFREVLSDLLPHSPSSPNSFTPSDTALGLLGGIINGADKLSRVAWLASDPAVAEVLGIEAIPSQSTLTRFLGVFSQRTSSELGKLHAWAAGKLPSHKDGYTLDMDSWLLLHGNSHQEGVAVGNTRNGPKPCHRPLVAALAEAQVVLGNWLRSGNPGCVNGSAEFLRHTLNSLPRHVAVGLVRADSGFSHASVLDELELRRMPYVMATRLTKPIQSVCRHDEAAGEKTDMEGMEVQEVDADQIGRRILVLRQRIARRPEAGWKMLLDVPGYRFQALVTDLPQSMKALAVWRRYNGCADIENRIKELGEQFGVSG